MLESYAKSSQLVKMPEERTPGLPARGYGADGLSGIRARRGTQIVGLPNAEDVSAGSRQRDLAAQLYGLSSITCRRSGGVGGGVGTATGVGGGATATGIATGVGAVAGLVPLRCDVPAEAMSPLDESFATGFVTSTAGATATGSGAGAGSGAAGAAATGSAGCASTRAGDATAGREDAASR